MKSIRHLILAIGLALAGCDDCKNISCEFGQCARGFCKCEEGYVGDLCQVQNEPESVVITSVEIKNLPESVLYDKTWDDDTTTANAYKPDVFLQVSLGGSNESVFNSMEKYPNTDSTRFLFDDQMRIVISDAFPALNLTLSDLDDPKPESMYTVQVAGYYRPTGGFPEEISGENEDGVKYSIFVEYVH